jgi:hypothetical protein
MKKKLDLYRNLKEMKEKITFRRCVDDEQSDNKKHTNIKTCNFF